MIINEELFALEDQCDKLVAELLKSPLYDSYLQNKSQLANQDTQALLLDFQQKKNAFDKIADYGIYAPDYREKNRVLRKSKRALDLNPEVADFREAETAFQGALDEICLAVASHISKNIKVDAGNPFFEGGSHAGCGGNCHAS
ncbi:YlbF family regulator [Enterococcus sp. HY326]|uniref:YlbF family regulator n=1 Tax=Enterococcus sp. HY326 TaxID=2971265 RepID=UPI00223EC593|nr:YlbF family regulator [Enterococcus sp. HY326]